MEARENPSWLAAMTTIAHAASGSRIYVSSCDLETEPSPNLLQSGGVHIRPHMALSGHFKRSRECPLLGVKRTCRFALQMSAFDPKRTSRLAS